MSLNFKLIKNSVGLAFSYLTESDNRGESVCECESARERRGEGGRERVNFVAKCDQKHYGYQNTFKV